MEESIMVQCSYKRFDGTFCEEEALPGSPNGYCIFHEELENKDIEGCMRLFYQKLRNGEENFEGYILKDVDLPKAGIKEIKQRVLFLNTKFYGDASFKNIEFKEYVDFLMAIFGGKVDFSKAKFEGWVNFSGATFEGGVDFSEATFEGGAYFLEAKFEGWAYFLEAKFEGWAYFLEAKFEGGVDFS
ncbi:MAG TPA: hypothetical protein ENI53_01550, partial [Thermoplasmatales archaeon]|nr:hypothetical protein [Thermoplasmatales archaeon]